LDTLKDASNEVRFLEDELRAGKAKATEQTFEIPGLV
jgi:hypothetical protein